MINTSIGKYRIKRLIGEGGMATVYEGEHEMLGTRVAIKVLNPILSSNAQIRERFKNEAKLMAALDHPNITKVIDFDEQPHQLSIVLEYLDGEDLSQKIKKNGPLAEKEVLKVFSQTLSAFQYAHEKGIVHRDIKPSNIFILSNGHVKILDFGIAKLFGQGNEMTQTGTQMGTPIYMSPEQVKADKSIDHRSDIYSLGVTMFFALNGKPPYDSITHSQFDIFSKIVFEPLPELSFDSQFNDIIKKACNKNREERFQSCKEWLDLMLNNNSSFANETVNSPTSNYNQSYTSNQSSNSSGGYSDFPYPIPKKNNNAVFIALAVVVFIVGALFILNTFILNNEYESTVEEYSEVSVADTTSVVDYPTDTSAYYNDGTSIYKQVKFENNSDSKAYVSIAYYQDNGWISEGWYSVDAYSSYYLDLPYGLQGDKIYWHAFDNNGLEWTGDAGNFLVEDAGPFKAKDGSFINQGGGNSSYKGFYELKLTSEITIQPFSKE
jgi:serine/threonine protein kinase